MPKQSIDIKGMSSQLELAGFFFFSYLWHSFCLPPILNRQSIVRPPALEWCPLSHPLQLPPMLNKQKSDTILTKPNINKNNDTPVGRKDKNNAWQRSGGPYHDC